MSVRWMQMIGLSFIICHLSFSLSACTKEETEVEEFDNWQWRNETFFASLQDSLRSNPAQWKRFKNYSLNPDIEGPSSEYIYVKVIEQGDDGDSPFYTDSVRLVYRGRLIPSATYPEGYVFDQTMSGTFSVHTAATYAKSLAGFVDGMATALQHMHRGDYWRVYIPSALGYGVEGDEVIPSHSTLIFDLVLVDFCHSGEGMPAWSSRQRR